MVQDGSKPKQRFGKLAAQQAARKTASPPKPFGRRVPVQITTLARPAQQKLAQLYAELSQLVNDPAGLWQTSISYDEKALVPLLKIGTIASVTAHNDPFALSIEAHMGSAGHMHLETTSVDIALDVILACITRNEEGPELAPQQAVTALIGHSIEDVERLLVMATLRRLNGNRTHAARTLGVSLRTIRNRLQTYARSIGSP